jgi:ABC-type branched-subunit amino acid transport system ATPase component
MSTLLAVQGLTKSFGGVRALDECGFEVPEGSVSALI